MKREQLEEFVKLTHCSTFEEAESKLGLSQARIGAQIATLEEEIGHSLFHKKAAGLELTGYGRALAERCPHIILELRHLDEALDEESTRLSKSVYMSFFASPHCFLLMPQVASALPHKLFTASVQASRDIVEDMGREHVHVAVMPTSAVPEGFLSKPLVVEQASLSVPFTSSLAGKESLALDDLTAEPMYMTSDIYGLSQWYEAIYAEAGGDLSRVQRPGADEYLLGADETPRNHFSSTVMQVLGNAGAQRVEIPIDADVARREISIAWQEADTDRVSEVVDYIAGNAEKLYSSRAFLPYLLAPGQQRNLSYINLAG